MNYKIKMYDYTMGEMLATENDNQAIAFAEMVRACMLQSEVKRLLEMDDKEYWDYLATWHDQTPTNQNWWLESR